MAVFRRTVRFANVTTGEVTFDNGYRIFLTITNSANIVADWINEAVAIYGPSPTSYVHQVVGLHVERSRPHGAIRLLQLCVGNRCLLYQLRHRDADPPRHLYTFLNDERFCFTGVGAQQAVHALRRDFRLTVKVAVDLGHAASRRLGREDLRGAGLEQLASEMMHFVIARPDELLWWTWAERELQSQQGVYACTNSFVSYELGRIVFCHGLLPFLSYGGS